MGSLERSTLAKLRVAALRGQLRGNRSGSFVTKPPREGCIFGDESELSEVALRVVPDPGLEHDPAEDQAACTFA